MQDQISSFYAKTDRILVPMAKGESSRMALNIATDLARVLNSEITALTVKDEVREVTWSDKVAVVMTAYREFRDKGLKIIPKIQSARNVKAGIVFEANSKNYDLVLMSSRARNGVSSSSLGGVSEYVLKHSKNTTAVISLKGSKYPYKNIFIPMSERLNSRKSVYLGAVLAKVFGAKFVLCDARSYDKKKLHGFKTIMNSEIWRELNIDYKLIELPQGDMKEEILNAISSGGSDLLVLGIRPDRYSNVRVNSEIKKLIRETNVDTLLIKR